MKKFIIAVCVLAALCFAAYTAYYRFGINLTVSPDRPVETFTRTDGQTILLERNGVYEPFEIRGVDMGAGIPGHWATDFAVDYDTYLRWFAQIQEMGANTIRVYTRLLSHSTPMRYPMTHSDTSLRYWPEPRPRPRYRSLFPWRMSDRVRQSSWRVPRSSSS